MRIFSRLLLITGALCSTILSGALHATSAVEIAQAAERFLADFAGDQERQGRNVHFDIGGLDPRLKLADCDGALSFEFVSEPEKNTRNTLLVSCGGARPWRLFLNAEIEISAPVYVAATPLTRGARITPEMLRQEHVVINQSRGGVYHSLDGLLGMEVRRAVREGTLLSPTLLTAPEAVARGDEVRIEAKTGAVVIVTRGTALTAGKIGEQIGVENNRSGREVRGVVIGPGHVRVVM